MTREEIIDISKKIVGNHTDKMEVEGIQTVNHKPHVPVVGRKTMKWAHERSSMVIGGDAPCSKRGCHLTLEEHKGDEVMFLKLLEPVEKEVGQNILKEIADNIGEKSVDGFAFISANKDCQFV